MPSMQINMEENSLKCLCMVNDQLSHKLDLHLLVNSCVSFTAFIFALANENDLFKENLNNVMGTDDFRKFLTSENNSF